MNLFEFERMAGASLMEAFRDPGSAVPTETATQRYVGAAGTWTQVASVPNAGCLPEKINAPMRMTTR